ncbi:HAD-IB family hydrolase [Candidatus Poribacteria bacterium]|nr:HAD-IB family hydrolase [Candidatus Poribacteria bacterium]
MESNQENAIAFFDVDGTLLSSTIVHCYLWIRTSTMSSIQKFFWMIGFIPKVVYYLILDRFNRSRFNQVFYRNYRNMDALQIQSSANDMFNEYLIKKVFPDAKTQIDEHKELNHQIVLVTGSLDFITEPIAAYFSADHVLSAKLEVQGSRYTGELTTSPVIGNEKAKIMAEYAKQEGVSLDDCYAYSDSLSDLAMLECVGIPVVVNPNKALRKKASETGWEIHEWMDES